MENFIPDRRAIASENKSSPTPAPAKFYKAEWLRRQETATADPQPVPAPQEEPPTDPVPTSEAPEPPYLPVVRSVPDLRVPFSNLRNHLIRPR
jgi:hypothetical protein